jgi:hypothetical protein
MWHVPGFPTHATGPFFEDLFPLFTGRDLHSDGGTEVLVLSKARTAISISAAEWEHHRRHRRERVINGQHVRWRLPGVASDPSTPALRQ